MYHDHFLLNRGSRLFRIFLKKRTLAVATVPPSPPPHFSFCGRVHCGRTAFFLSSGKSANNQFSSRWCISIRENCMRSTNLRNNSFFLSLQCSLRERSNVGLTGNGHTLSLFKADAFFYASSKWTIDGVMSFLSSLLAGTVSSYKTFRAGRDASQL